MNTRQIHTNSNALTHTHVWPKKCAVLARSLPYFIFLLLSARSLCIHQWASHRNIRFKRRPLIRCRFHFWYCCARDSKGLIVAICVCSFTLKTKKRHARHASFSLTHTHTHARINALINDHIVNTHTHPYTKIFSRNLLLIFDLFLTILFAFIPIKNAGTIRSCRFRLFLCACRVCVYLCAWVRVRVCLKTFRREKESRKFVVVIFPFEIDHIWNVSRFFCDDLLCATINDQWPIPASIRKPNKALEWSIYYYDLAVTPDETQTLSIL